LERAGANVLQPADIDLLKEMRDLPLPAWPHDVAEDILSRHSVLDEEKEEESEGEEQDEELQELMLDTALGEKDSALSRANRLYAQLLQAQQTQLGDHPHLTLLAKTVRYVDKLIAEVMHRSAQIAEKQNWDRLFECLYSAHEPLREMLTRAEARLAVYRQHKQQQEQAPLV